MREIDEVEIRGVEETGRDDFGEIIVSQVDLS